MTPLPDIDYFRWDYWDIHPAAERTSALDTLFPDDWSGDDGDLRTTVCGAVPSWVHHMLTIAVTANPRHLAYATLADCPALTAAPLTAVADYLAHPDVPARELAAAVHGHLWEPRQLLDLINAVWDRNPTRTRFLLDLRPIPVGTRRRLLNNLLNRHRPLMKRFYAGAHAVNEAWLADATVDLVPLKALHPHRSAARDAAAIARRLLSTATPPADVVLAVDQTHQIPHHLRRRLAARLTGPHQDADIDRDLALLSLNGADALTLAAAVPAEYALDELLPRATLRAAQDAAQAAAPDTLPPDRLLELLSQDVTDLPRRGLPRTRPRPRPWPHIEGRTTAVAAWAVTATNDDLARELVRYTESPRVKASNGRITEQLAVVLSHQVSLRAEAGAVDLLPLSAHHAAYAWTRPETLRRALADCPTGAIPYPAAVTLRDLVCAQLLAAGHAQVADMVCSLAAGHDGTVADLVTAAAVAAGVENYPDPRHAADVPASIVPDPEPGGPCTP